MKNVKVFLTDGNFSGSITMTSGGSKISAIRVKKDKVSDFNNELNEAGIYLLLVGNDDVYVGESGLETIGSRIMKPHSVSIDSSWHTVVGFAIADSTIGKNELLYMENAMCERVYKKFGKCLTTVPAQKTCNAAFRKSHYK